MYVKCFRACLGMVLRLKNKLLLLLLLLPKLWQNVVTGRGSKWRPQGGASEMSLVLKRQQI